MEPPGPDVLRRPAPPVRRVLSAELRTAAAVGGATLALLSTGDAVLLVVLVGLAGGEALAGAAATLAVLAAVLRWGTTSLEAIAGAQAVLGPAAAVGPTTAAASAGCAAAALVLASPGGRAAPVLGLVAGLVVAGPAPSGVASWLVRLAAGAAGAVLAVAVGRHRGSGPVIGWLAVALGAAAVGLAVAG